MSSSKIVKIVIGFLAVALSMVLAPASRGGPMEHKNVVYDEANRLEDPGPLPSPGYPVEPQTTTLAAGIQMVGYTAEVLPANRGILNMTLACQKEFPGTRVCSVDEVLASFVVPEPPPGVELTYIWARSAGTVAQSLIGQIKMDAAAVDCRGWTSAARADSGVVIALGPGHACHGGVVEAPCSAVLPLACCGLAR